MKRNTLLLLGGAGLGLYLLTRAPGATAPGGSATHCDPSTWPVGSDGRVLVPRSCTAGSYTDAGVPIPYPIGQQVRLDLPDGRIGVVVAG